RSCGSAPLEATELPRRDNIHARQLPALATLDHYIHEDLTHMNEAGVDCACVDIPKEAIGRRSKLHDARELSVQPRAAAAGLGRAARCHLYRIQVQGG